MIVSFSFLQQVFVVFLRFVVGWHLFFQGLGKWWTIGWSSKGYLENARGPFASLIQYIPTPPMLLSLADFTVVYGLIFSGLFLMLGLFSRFAALSGFFLLLLFFVASPPLPYLGFAIPGPEGSELYVNKTLIEALFLLFLAFIPTGKMAGLDILISDWLLRRNSVFRRRK